MVYICRVEDLQCRKKQATRGPFHSGSLDFVYPVYPHETPLLGMWEDMGKRGWISVYVQGMHRGGGFVEKCQD